MDLPIAIGVCIVVLVAAATDIWRRKIYNWLTFPAILLALTYHALTGGFAGLLHSLLGFLAGLGLMLIPHLLGKMGAGDVKLMAAVGAALGPAHVFWAVILASLAGGIYALAVLIIRSGLTSMKMTDAWIKLSAFGPQGLAADLSADQSGICYGIPLAAGTIAYLALNLSGVWAAPWT